MVGYKVCAYTNTLQGSQIAGLISDGNGSTIPECYDEQERVSFGSDDSNKFLGLAGIELTELYCVTKRFNISQTLLLNLSGLLISGVDVSDSHCLVNRSVNL